MALDPSLAEILRSAIEARLVDVHTAMPGRVVKYDSATQKADIEPVVSSAVMRHDGSRVNEKIPVIANVPVCWPRGGGYSLQFPLDKGDHVLLVFSEVATAQWRTSGSPSEPGHIARHDLSYCVAIPCEGSDKQPLDDILGDRAVLDGPTELRLGGPTADFLATNTAVLAELVLIAAVLNGLVPGSYTPPVSVGTTKLKGE